MNSTWYRRALASLASCWLAVAAHAQQSEPLPINLRLKGKEILGLKLDAGFRRFNQLIYIVDPGLKYVGSDCFQPPKRRKGTASVLRNGVEELKIEDSTYASLVKKPPQGDLPLYRVVKEVLADFCNKLCSEPQRKVDLKQLLEHLGGKAEKPLVTFALKFWVLRTGDQASLACRLELRAFRIATEEIKEGNLAGYADLKKCELVFQDVAVGVAPLAGPDDQNSAENAARAAIIQALRRRIAVNFALNPVHAAKLFGESLALTRGSLEGSSISKFKEVK